METQAEQNKFLVPISIVVAGVLIAGAIYLGDSKGGNLTTDSGQAVTKADVPEVTERDHVVGPRDAEIMIVEYSDTECPFCKVFHNTMKEVMATYPGKVAWTYRHFPIVKLHARAHKEAEATECAYEQGGHQAFWNYIDRMFETTNSNDSLDPSLLPEIAAQVGLDAEALSTCLSSGRYTEFINKSVEASVKAGARGTPYSVILTKDGKQIVINGAEPIEMVKAKIDSLLK